MNGSVKSVGHRQQHPRKGQAMPDAQMMGQPYKRGFYALRGPV